MGWHELEFVTNQKLLELKSALIDLREQVNEMKLDLYKLEKKVEKLSTSQEKKVMIPRRK